MKTSPEVPDPVNWEDPEQVELLRWVVSQRTPESLSIFGRHVLGYDYYEIGERASRVRTNVHGWRWQLGRWRTCGLVAWGPHRQIAAALMATDDVLLLCSRNALKTTWSLAFDIWSICMNRNERILEFMETKEQASESLLVIAEHLESNEKLHRLFGTFRETGTRWTSLKMTVSNRTPGMRDPSFAGHGNNSRKAGSRCTLFHVDDPIGEESAQNPEMVLKSNQKFFAMQPLVAAGGRTVVNMTPYAATDLSFVIRADQHMGFRVVEIPCGVEAHRDDDGTIQIRGVPRFPHMGFTYLLGKARKMGVVQFNMNYALQIRSTGSNYFQRDDFPVEGWDDRFGLMNAFLMTDIAESENLSSCITALSVVCLDFDDTAFVIDVDCGYWAPSTTLENFLALFSKWATRLRICGVVMERTNMNKHHRAAMEREMRVRNLSARWIEIPRGPKDQKHSRILASQQRIASRRLRLVDTIRRDWMVGKDARLLFNPQAETGPNGNPLPGGELIDQYLNFHPTYTGLIDIPDMLADLDATDAKGVRYLATTQRRIEDVEQAQAAFADRLRDPQRKLRLAGMLANSMLPTNQDDRPIWERMA